MELLADLGETFVLGLLTPLGAVCVLPLYPGFLAYLANQLSGRQASRKTFIYFGLIISSGVILFMTLLGLIFSTILEVSLTNVIQVVSPIAFGILFLISLLLIFNVDMGRFLPKARAPITKNPLANAFVFGFFFGAIVVPCNPAFIAALCRYLRCFIANHNKLPDQIQANNKPYRWNNNAGYINILFSICL